jgi:hypothetical protein
LEAGATDVDEGDVLAHLCGKARGKCGNLPMDVHEEGVGRPSSLFSDGVAVSAVKFHGHGATGPEGVAAHESRGEAGGFKAQCLDGGFDVGVDVSGVHVFRLLLGVVGSQGSFDVRGVLQNMGDLAGECCYGEMLGGCALVVQMTWPLVPFFWLVMVRVAASAVRRNLRCDELGRMVPSFQKVTSQTRNCLVRRCCFGFVSVYSPTRSRYIVEGNKSEVANGLLLWRGPLS